MLYTTRQKVCFPDLIRSLRSFCAKNNCACPYLVQNLYNAWYNNVAITLPFATRELCLIASGELSAIRTAIPSYLIMFVICLGLLLCFSFISVINSPSVVEPRSCLFFRCVRIVSTQCAWICSFVEFYLIISLICGKRSRPLYLGDLNFSYSLGMDMDMCLCRYIYVMRISFSRMEFATIPNDCGWYNSFLRRSATTPHTEDPTSPTAHRSTSFNTYNYLAFKLIWSL